jgi:hypothetical protein
VGTRRTEAAADDAILRLPLITPDTLARALNVGSGMVKSAARRVGIRHTRMPNRRDYISATQAIAVHREILRRSAG